MPKSSNYERIERKTEETLDTAKADEKRNTPAQHEDSISIQQVEMKSQSDCAKIAEPERMNAPAASKPEMQVTPIKTIETVAETDTAYQLKWMTYPTCELLNKPKSLMLIRILAFG